MSDHARPLIALTDIVKDHGSGQPLRVRRLELRARERLAVFGLDAAAAETVMHLITAAALPDEGRVEIDGQDTRTIATDTDWLLSLDRFGIVTRRAVLLETMTAAANIALTLTASIDPMSNDTRACVVALADDVQLPASRLDVASGALTPGERARLHLARALALDPRVLLLEHPTGDVTEDVERAAIGRTLHVVAERRGIGWIAFTNDRAFADAARGERRTLDVHTGMLAKPRWWQIHRNI
jgi:ABC-type lipoprotein export system ATPase subunit